MNSEEKASPKERSGIAAKATVIVASTAINIIGRMTSLMILTRVLIKEDFSLFSFVILTYTTLTTVLQLGLPDSIFYFFERVPKESRKSFALSTGKILFFIGLGCTPILIALTYLAPLWGFKVGGLFIPLMFLAVLELPTAPLPNILIAIDKAKRAAWLNICNSTVLFMATVLPAVLGQPLIVIVYSLAGYGVIRFIVSSFMFFRNFPDTRSPLPKGIVREQFKYSVPLGLAQILSKLNTATDKYVVAAFLPVAVFAEYFVGSWEIPLLPMIAHSVASVMMPQFVSLHLQGDKETLLLLWFKSIKKVSIIVLPLTILLLLIADEFIAVAFSENYVQAAIPFRIYTLILLHRVASYGSILRAVGKTRTITYAALYLFFINLVLNFPFVMLWGIAGPPTATLLANIILWIYILVKIKDALNVSLKEVFPFGFYGKVLFISLLAGVPVLFLDFWLEAADGTVLLLKVITFLIIYSVISTGTGIMKKSDWLFLAGFIGLKSKGE